MLMRELAAFSKQHEIEALHANQCQTGNFAEDCASPYSTAG